MNDLDYLELQLRRLADDLEFLRALLIAMLPPPPKFPESKAA